DPGGVLDMDEPARLARAVAGLRLRHAVITAVARDDLADGGASVFAECIRQVRARSPQTIIEVLTPDFLGDTEAIDSVLKAGPDIFNHNIETVERLTPRVRSKAKYRRSLEVLNYARKCALTQPSPARRAGEGERSAGEGRLKTKSGLMLGLG